MVLRVAACQLLTTMRIFNRHAAESRTSMPETQVKLSIVIPLYNEEDNVRPLYTAIRKALVSLGQSHEIIFVDDGSSDHTLENLLRIQESATAVRVVKFRRNFGQTAAMRAGIQIARGSIIVTMDGDLQNDPRDIPKLVEKIESGSDLAIGWRRDRKDPLLSRKLPSRIANRLIGKITGVSVKDSGCSLKAYRGEVIKRVPLYSELHRFIPAMSTIQGARISEVAVRHHPRTHGKSKYGLSRIAKVLLDVVAVKMLIAFRHRPLYWFSTLAIPFWLASCVTGVTYLVLRLGADKALVVPQIAFLLFTYLAAHFLAVGLLAELAVRSERIHGDYSKATVEHLNSPPDI